LSLCRFAHRRAPSFVYSNKGSKVPGPPYAALFAPAFGRRLTQPGEKKPGLKQKRLSLHYGASYANGGRQLSSLATKVAVIITIKSRQDLHNYSVFVTTACWIPIKLPMSIVRKPAARAINGFLCRMLIYYLTPSLALKTFTFFIVW